MKKPFTKKISLLVATLALSFTGLSAATTDPVGYVSLNLKGGNGETNLISNAGLVQPSDSAGLGVISGGTLLTTSSSAWSIDEFLGTHYVQIPSTGEWSAITANSENTLTLEKALTNATDVSFVIRKLNTLDLLFGSNNSAGFTSETSLGVSDIVAVWDQSNQNLTGLYYFNSSSLEWQDASNTSAGSTIIYPDETLVVFAKSDKTIVLSGSIQTGATSGNIVGGNKTSLVPNPYPIDLEISKSGLEDIINGGSDFGSSDKVLIWNSATSSFSNLYYYDTDSGEEGWKNVSNQSVTGNDVIPVGQCAVIIKSGDDGEWTTQQPFNL